MRYPGQVCKNVIDEVDNVPVWKAYTHLQFNIGHISSIILRNLSAYVIHI